MAQFSQGFLSSLGRPEMSQSLFGLGAAIGGVPGQMKQRKKEQAFNQLMQQVQAAQGSGDFASMKALSQQMAQTNPQQAAQIMQAAIAGEEKQKRIQAGSGMFSGTPEEARASAKQSAALGDFASAQQALAAAEKLEQQGKKVGRARTSAQMLMSEIQGIMKTPNISEANKEKALGLLREAAVAGEDSDLLKPRVDELKQSLLPVKRGKTTRGDETTVRDKSGNLFTRTIQYDEQGKATVVLTPYKEGSTLVSPTTGAGAFDQPGLAGKKELEKEFSELRIEAIDRLPSLERSFKNAEKSLELLEQINTGGFTTSVVRSAQNLLGVTPANEAEFQTLAGKNVLQGLEVFTGAISNSEREYLERLYESLEKSNFANKAILKLFMEEYRDSIENAQLRADSTSFDDYNTKQKERRSRKQEEQEEETTFNFNDLPNN